MEYHGRVLGQSGAIARFLSSKSGIYGDGDLDRARIDAVVDYVEDYNSSEEDRKLPVFFFAGSMSFFDIRFKFYSPRVGVRVQGEFVRGQGGRHQ